TESHVKSIFFHKTELSMHSLWLPGGLAPPCRVLRSGRKSIYVRSTASTEAVSLHDGSPLGDSSPSHRQRSRACVTTTDPFSIMEKSDESQFFENMTIYLKTKKMLSQWTKQMRWRIKKSLPSFVSYVDVEPYAVSRLQHN